MTAFAANLRFGLSDSLVLARRNLSHVRQIPEKLIDVTVQPLMFVLLFAYVFGGAIAVSGGDYHEYLMGGIFIQTLTFGVMGPATSMANDLSEGVLDRFRSLPMARSAFMVGHVLAEFAAALLGLAVMTAAGLVVGWRIHTDVPHAAAGFALLLLVAFAMLWVGMLLGTVARSADAVTGIVFIVIFPLTFVSNAFVPAGTLPGVLQTVAEWNPISALAAGLRTLFGNPTATPHDAAWPLQHPVASSFMWCGAAGGDGAPGDRGLPPAHGGLGARCRNRTPWWCGCALHLGHPESMSITRLTATALALTALAPAAALASGVHSNPQLGGNPQMRVVDDHHATLNFASDRLPRTAAGEVDAKITFVTGARVTDITPVGTHGNDIRYAARVTSQSALKLHQKFTVKFRLGDAKTVSRFVKLFAVGEHG